MIPTFLYCYKNRTKKVLENEEWIQVLARLNQEKNLTYKEMVAFTTLCVFAYYFGQGDALAGMMLSGFLRGKTEREIIKKVLGKIPTTPNELYAILHTAGYMRIVSKILKE